jgi:hypothetical protein
VGQGVLPNGALPEGAKGEGGENIGIGDQKPVEAIEILLGMGDPSPRSQKTLLFGKKELDTRRHKVRKHLAHHLPFVVSIDDNPRYPRPDKKVDRPGNGRSTSHRNQRFRKIRKERANPGAQTRGQDKSAESHGEGEASGKRREEEKVS